MSAPARGVRCGSSTVCQARAPAAVAALVVALSVWLAPWPAAAHGRAPGLGQVVFDGADRAHVVVRATWGFLTTRDGGRTWTWQCAAAVPFDRTREDPVVAMCSGGTLLAATFTGLVRSDERGCSWAPPVSGVPAQYVTDVVVDPGRPGVAWSIVSPGSTPDGLHRSDDRGATWTQVSTPHPRALTDRVRPAPSDPSRIYTSGVIPRTDTEARVGVLLRSDDGGASFRAIEVPLLEPELTVHVLAVAPTDPDVLFLRAVRRSSDTTAERLLRSADGGATWVTVLETPSIAGVAVGADGTTVWVASGGGLRRSEDRGDTFEVLDGALRARCLAWREPEAGAPGELWVCADGVGGGVALATSEDRGVTLVPRWSFGQVTEDVGCPTGTPVGDTCPAYWGDLTFDLFGDAGVPFDAGGRDAGLEAGPDGGEIPRAAMGCGCSSAGRRRHGEGVAALSTMMLLAARARRRRACVRD